jgi:outer membrane protein
LSATAGDRLLHSYSAIAGLLCFAALAHAAVAADDPFGVDRLRPPAVNAAWAGSVPDPCPPDAVPPAVLSLVDAIDFALCRNPDTRITWSNARVAAAQVGVARSERLPTADAAATLQRAETRNVPSSGGRSELSGSAIVNYVLFDFGARDARLDSARESLLAANWSHNATLQAVLFGVVQAYYQVFASGEAVSATLEAERAALESLEASAARQQAGRATRVDVLQAQTAYSQALLNRTRAEGDAANARAGLANALGLRADRAFTLAAPPSLDDFALAEQAVERLIDTAKLGRPELLAAQAQVRAAESNLRAAQAADRPTISLFGSAGATQASPGADPLSGAIGVRLQVPLFTGYRSAYQVRSAREQIETRLAERDRLDNLVSLEVWQSWRQLETEGQSYRTTLDLVASAREAYEAALARYRAGVGTLIDLLNAQSATASADFQRIQAQYNWYLAKAALVRALGTLDPALFAQPSAAINQ